MVEVVRVWFLEINDDDDEGLGENFLDEDVEIILNGILKIKSGNFRM